MVIHEWKQIARRVKSHNFVNGSHNLSSVWDQGGATVGVGLVVRLLHCVGVWGHCGWSQFCHEHVFVQCRESLLCHIIFVREVNDVVLGSLSQKFFTESHGSAKFQGREGVSSVGGILSLWWPRVSGWRRRIADWLRVGGGVPVCCS